MEASVKSLYISTSANRYSHCSARHSKGLVAFGAGRGIALWDSIVRALPVLLLTDPSD